jgi:hypothetical protein
LFSYRNKLEVALVMNMVLQGAHVEQVVGRVSAREEESIGGDILGERVFLCHGADDGRDDQAVFGASL